MSPRRPRRRKRALSLPNSTITIIITTTTDMADIMGMMRLPASSSCLADTVITITTIITIITASIAATIEVARSDDDKTGPRGPVFFVDSTTSSPQNRLCEKSRVFATDGPAVAGAQKNLSRSGGLKRFPQAPHPHAVFY